MATPQLVAADSAQPWRSGALRFVNVLPFATAALTAGGAVHYDSGSAAGPGREHHSGRGPLGSREWCIVAKPKEKKAAAPPPGLVVKDGESFDRWRRDRVVDFRQEATDSKVNAILRHLGAVEPKLVEDDHGLHVVYPPLVIPNPVQNKRLAELAGIKRPDYVSAQVRDGIRQTGGAVRRGHAGIPRWWTHDELRKAAPYVGGRLGVLLGRIFPGVSKP